MSQPIFREGTINFTYDGEIYQTYYKLFGELDGRTRDPIVVLHGGPGLVHDYLFPFANLATQHNFPVILYDQIGNGRSSHIKEKDPAFWTIDLFIDELVNLITHFSIQDGFDLVGHSWGGILASEFEVRRQPAGLKRLVLSNSLPAISLWTQSNMQLLEAFPEEVKKGIMEGMKDPEGYFRALKELHAVHGCLARPIPAEYWYTLDQVFGPAGDPTVASAPIIKGWSIIDRLHLIRMPTFVINGRKDLAQDFVVQPFFEGIQKVKWVTLESSSHSPFIEETDKYMKLVADFLAF